MPEGLAEALANLALGSSVDVLPAVRIDRCVLVVLDTLAAIIGAGPEPEVAGIARHGCSLGLGEGPATVLLTGAGAAPYAAAFVNGLATTRLELDEGNQWAGNHAPAHVLPAALATAEAVHASGTELLEAVSAGYEVAVRVGRATRLRSAVHPFGTAMVVGAAAAVARLRSLDPATTAQALLVGAGMTPASMQRAANDGATVRNAASGQCAATGVLAVDLAATGTTGHPEAFEIVYGDILGEEFRAELAWPHPGDEPYLPRGYFKLHACSRWNHAAIEATRMLLDEEGLTAEEVADVVVATFAPADRLDSPRPVNGFAARHSIPYAVASRLVYGANGLEQYTDAAVSDERVQRLSALVRVVEDPAMTRQSPLVRAARVEVTTTDGRHLARTADRIPGGPEWPYPASVIYDKARVLLTRGLGEVGAEAMIDFVSNLPEREGLEGLRPIVASAYAQAG